MSKVKEYETLNDLFIDFPWRTEKKFIPLAQRHGFEEKEIKKFLRSQAFHDEKIKKPKFLPIYSKIGDSYQMDTLIQKRARPFLIVININTRKANAYMMQNKGAKEVKKALEKFFDETPVVKTLVSDQDSAYLSNDVLTFLKSKNVSYRTTEDNNHNVLGIINRFMRTLRDLNDGKNFTEERMQQLVSEYNATPHSGIDNETPDNMDEDKEKEYIKAKTQTFNENEYHFNDGDHVRIVLDKVKIGKNRTNLSKEAYIIDGKVGNQWLISSIDGSVDKYPGWRLVKCDDRYKIAETIKGGKRGIVSKIISYDGRTDKYKVEYSEGTIDTISAKNLREGDPLRLSPMEREYWIKQKVIPVKIRQWF